MKMGDNDKKKKTISPYTRLDRKYKEAIIRFVGMMMRRHQLTSEGANYILEPLGEKAKLAFPGMAFFDEKGKRLT